MCSPARSWIMEDLSNSSQNLKMVYSENYFNYSTLTSRIHEELYGFHMTVPPADTYVCVWARLSLSNTADVTCYESVWRWGIGTSGPMQQQIHWSSYIMCRKRRYKRKRGIRCNHCKDMNRELLIKQEKRTVSWLSSKQELQNIYQILSGLPTATMHVSDRLNWIDCTNTLWSHIVSYHVILCHIVWYNTVCIIRGTLYHISCTVFTVCSEVVISSILCIIHIHTYTVISGL